MKDKNFKTVYIISIILTLIAFCIIIFTQKKEIYLKNFIHQQIKILNNPITFIDKVQYFYDKALFEHKKNKKMAIKDLEIAKSFLSTQQKNTYIIQIINQINKTENNIKNNVNLNSLSYQEILFKKITLYTHNYYSKMQDILVFIQKLIDKYRENIKIIQISIFLLLVALIATLIIYKFKKLLENYAYKDPLTDAYNRRYFYEKIKKLPNNTNSLIMIDIDHFKLINDMYGHEMGDYILKELINLIKILVRKNDIIVRWGGEEFIILLKNVNSNKAVKIAEKIRKTIESYNFKGIKITASFGVKETKGTITSDDLKILDKALYLSKTKGRNQVNILY